MVPDSPGHTDDTVGPDSGEDAAYWTAFSETARIRLNELADLCEVGRETFAQSSNEGFTAREGAESMRFEAAATGPDWPGGAWSTGAATPIHQVGLMIALQAAGHLGEMAPLLRPGEVIWSLPLLSRGVAESCSRLFAIYVRPVLSEAPGSVSPEAMKQVFAAAYLEVLSAGFSARRLASETLDLDAANVGAQEQLVHAESELSRLQGAYGALFDPSTTDVSTANRLALEGRRIATMTDLLNDLAAWMWPDSTRRPPPLYRVLSGLAHGSLDAQIALFNVEDTAEGRQLTRSIPVEHVEYLVLVGGLLFQRTFARLAGFYDWSEGPLNRYSELLAETFPDRFTYG